MRGWRRTNALGELQRLPGDYSPAFEGVSIATRFCHEQTSVNRELFH
jgi:hypothetical protein